MIIHPSLLALALQLPTPDERTSESYLRRSPNVTGKEDVTAVEVELWIDEKGKTRSCRLLQSIGSREIAVRMCRKAIGTQFKPAKNVDGEPTHGLLKTILTVFPFEYRNLARAQEKALSNNFQTLKISLEVSGEYFQSTQPNFLNLLVSIDEQGHQTHCQASENTPSEIAKIACENSAQFTFDIRTSRKALPVAYVREVSIEFVQAPAR